MRKGGQIYFLKKETADFFLLDDQTIFPKINKLIKYIQQAGYNPTVLKVKDISQLNQQIWSRGWYAPEFRYVGIGDGGRSVLSQLVKSVNIPISYEHVRFSQEIKNNQITGYSHNLFDYRWENTSVILVEDVIASGGTIYELTRYLEKAGANIIGIVSLVTYNPIIKYIKYPIITRSLINRLDLNILIPPLYSYRHLVHGEGELFSFYQYICKTYFENDKTFMKIMLGTNYVPNESEHGK